jgi:hypothetical protein
MRKWMLTGFGLENPEGRSLGRHRRRWENNIKIDLREEEWG